MNTKPLSIRVFFDIGIYIVFVLLAIVYTFPLITELSTSNAGDKSQFAWFIDYFYNQLQSGLSPLARTDQMYYPFGFYPVQATDNFLHLGIGALFRTVTSSIVAVNLLLIIQAAFASFGAYLLGKKLYQNRAYAFLLGLFFGISAFILYRSTGHLNIISAGMFPLVALSLIQLHEQKNTYRMILAGISIAALVYSSMGWILYIYPLLLVGGILYLWKTKEWKYVLKSTVISGAVCTLLLSPLLYFFLQAKGISAPRAESDYATYSADALSYVVPPSILTLGGSFKNITSQFTGNAVEQGAFIPWIVSIVFLLTLLSFKKLTFPYKNILLYSSTVFFILSLGDILHIAGISQFTIGSATFTVPMPFRLLREVFPLVDIIRTPNRYSILCLLGVSILATAYLQHKQLHKNKALYSILVIAFLAFQTTFGHYPSQAYHYSTPTFNDSKLTPDSTMLFISTESQHPWLNTPVPFYSQHFPSMKFVSGYVSETAVALPTRQAMEIDYYAKGLNCSVPPRDIFITLGELRREIDYLLIDKRIRESENCTHVQEMDRYLQESGNTIEEDSGFVLYEL